MDSLIPLHVKAEDLKPGMHIVANEYYGVAKKIRNVTVLGGCVIVDYTTDMSGRTFRVGDTVELA